MHRIASLSGLRVGYRFSQMSREPVHLDNPEQYLLQSIVKKHRIRVREVLSPQKQQGSLVAGAAYRNFFRSDPFGS